jgi:hypothetical protein
MPVVSRGNFICLSFIFVSVACRKDTTKSDSASVEVAPSASAIPSVAIRTPLAGERVEIPSGSFRAGSQPGTPGRYPALEPTLHSVELGSYEIDRLPFPNDPARPPLTGLTRDEARSRCAESGARLCTELEWERACKGPDSKPYSTGEQFDDRCLLHPNQCATGFDVLAMGVGFKEWTASDIGSTTDAMAAVRGSNAKSPNESHRCATRIGSKSNSRDKDVAFRCCKGAPNAATVAEPALGKAFEKAPINTPRLVQILDGNPITKQLNGNVQLFREPEAADTVVEKGSGDRKGLTFSVAPVIWNPSLGVRILLMTGRSGKDTSFVLAYNVISKDDYSLAASFIMKNDPGPVALAFDDSIRPRLFFSTCWGCPGETGRILFREPEAVVIVQP